MILTNKQEQERPVNNSIVSEKEQNVNTQSLTNIGEYDWMNGWKKSDLYSEDFFFRVMCLKQTPREKSERYSIVMEIARNCGEYEGVKQFIKQCCEKFDEDFECDYWEKPKPFHEDKELPVFPLKTLPQALQGYVEAVARIKQVSPDMVAVGVLGAFSAAIQKKYNVTYGNMHDEPVSLYVVIGADPAERKSSVLSALRKPFLDYQNALEAVLAPDDDKPRLFSSGDCTQEKLAEMMSENNEKIAILAEEGGIFDILGGRYSGMPNIELIKQAYDGSDVTIDRKKSKSLHLRNPAISAVIYCQLGVIQKFVRNITFLEQGLCGRFMYALPEKYAGSGNREYKREFTARDVEAYERATEWYSKAILDFLKLPLKEKPTLVWVAENAEPYASKMFDYYESLIGGVLKTRSDWGGKAFGRVMRIGAILALINGETEISLETLQKAFKIGDYLIEHAKDAYGMVGNNPIANEAERSIEFMRKKLQRYPDYQFTRRDFTRFFKGSVEPRKLTEILELLESCNYIRQFEYTPETGRPSIKIYVNKLI